MAQPNRPRLRDLRDAYRLIGECRELGTDPVAWRRHMLEGLRRLCGAQVALYLQIDRLRDGAERIVEPLDAGFLDSHQRALWSHYQREQAHRDDSFHQRYYAGFTGALLTRSLSAVVDDREWRRSRHYNEYVRACGLDDRITSSIQLPDNPSRVQAIVLHRAAIDGQYSRRALRLVHLFHHEMAYLLGRTLAMPGGEATLPPQLTKVLNCLLVGDAEKQIAGKLGISPQTVSRHVQRLYRRFNVHSRGELMFRCRDLRPRLSQ